MFVRFDRCSFIFVDFHIYIYIYIYIYDGCQKLLTPAPDSIISFRVIFVRASRTFGNCGFLMGPFLVPVSSDQDRTIFDHFWPRFWWRFCGPSALRFHHSGGPPKTIRKTLPVSTHMGHFRALAALWPESSSASPAETDQKRSETESWKHWENVFSLMGALRDSFADLWELRGFEVYVWFLVLASGLPCWNLRGPSGTAVFLKKRPVSTF